MTIEDNTSDEKIIRTYFNKYYHLVISGSVALIILSLFNIYDQYALGFTSYYPIFGYIAYALRLTALIPIAIGLLYITEEFFTEHITKYGKDAYSWLMIYSLIVIVNLIFLGWPLIAVFAGAAIVFGRIISFYCFSTVMRRISFVTNLKVGGFIYLLYAFFSVIVAFFTWISNTADDTVATMLIIVFNGLFESTLLIWVAIKIIIDFSRIKKYVISEGIMPNCLDQSLFTTKTTTPAHRTITTKLKQEEVSNSSVASVSGEKRELVSSSFVDKEEEDKLEKQSHHFIPFTTTFKGSEQRLLSEEKEKSLQTIILIAALSTGLIYLLYLIFTT